MTEPPPRTMQALKSFVVALLMIDAIFQVLCFIPALEERCTYCVHLSSMERGFTFVIWTLMIVAILFDQLSLLPFMIGMMLFAAYECAVHHCAWVGLCRVLVAIFMSVYMHFLLEWYRNMSMQVQQQKHNPLGLDSSVQDGTNQTNAPSEMPQVLIQPIEMSTQSQAVCESTNTAAIEQSSAQNSQESPNSSNIKPV